jgi:hypothetical protein
MAIDTNTVYRVKEHDGALWIHRGETRLREIIKPGMGESLHLDLAARQGQVDVTIRMTTYLHVRVNSHRGISTGLIVLGLLAMGAGAFLMSPRGVEEFSLGRDEFYGMIGLIGGGLLLTGWGIKRAFWGNTREWVQKSAK